MPRSRRRCGYDDVGYYYLSGRRVGQAEASDSMIRVPVEPGYLLVLGGGGERILSAKSAGHPCPECRTKIVKEAFLGGAIYFCPRCQPAPARKP